MNVHIAKMYEVYKLSTGQRVDRWSHKGSAMLQCKASPDYRYRVVYVEVPVVDGIAYTSLAY